MTGAVRHYDAIVIGGGFYGCEVASYLVKERGFKKVLIVEREEKLMNRASLRNQARVHGGYHYPRDFVTAHRSRVSRPRFFAAYPSAVMPGVTSIYAIARSGSHVRPDAFSRRMKEAGANLYSPSPAVTSLFSKNHIDAVFEVEEDVFNAVALGVAVEGKIRSLRIETMLGAQAVALKSDSEHIVVTAATSSAEFVDMSAQYVFNCTYSGLNTVQPGKAVRADIKHEIAELTLIRIPPEIEGLGITVMDGAFFSTLPYPPASAYSLSHVRYTPQSSWHDEGAVDPYSKLDEAPQDSRAIRMLRDAARYVPVLANASIVGSFREVKTVLVENEDNDGRPILIEKSREFSGMYSILGAKIDNIFDVFEYLSKEDLQLGDGK